MRQRRWVWLLPVLVAVLLVAACEAGIRAFVKPSAHAYGTFRGVELPPFKVVPHGHAVAASREAPVDGVVADGVRLTHGDLFGYFKDDPEIGYVWEEGRRSAHGWWVSNEIGARSSVPTPKEVPEGRTRWAIFGDSFAAGTRVRQDETWTARLQEMRPELDVVNLGVDGYGLGQAFLTDRRMRNRIAYDMALYVWVPYHDPWRDVNVIRYLGERWGSSSPMPRFVLDGEGIRLVPPLYPRGTTVYERDYPEASPELRAHLRAYDRFYVPALYEPALATRLMFWKLIVARRERHTQKLTRRAIGTDVGGEAFELSRRILLTARDEGRTAGRRVVVVVLPVERDLEVLDRLDKARVRWRAIVDSLQARGLEVLDLAPALSVLPPEERDSGIDGTHYGPKMSRAIARAIAEGVR